MVPALVVAAYYLASCIFEKGIVGGRPEERSVSPHDGAGAALCPRECSSRAWWRRAINCGAPGFVCIAASELFFAQLCSTQRGSSLVEAPNSMGFIRMYAATFACATFFIASIEGFTSHEGGLMQWLAFGLWISAYQVYKLRFLEVRAIPIVVVAISIMIASYLGSRIRHLVELAKVQSGGPGTTGD
jgi:hypothetical protein